MSLMLSIRSDTCDWSVFLFCCSAPVFYFGEAEYYADESDGYVEVKVWRTGTDLSKSGTVTVHSRKTEPVSAEGTFSFLNQNPIYY